MAGDLHPQGIHVAYILIDGRIGAGSKEGTELDPDEIAAT